MNGFKEEIAWLDAKIKFLEKADKTGAYKEEIKMLKRIKNNYSYSKERADKLSSEISWTKNPEPGY